MSKKIITLATPDLSQNLTAKLLGEAVRARRTQSNLRQEDAAALCGVAKQTYMQIEHGNSNTKLGSVLKVCAALGIKLNISPWMTTEEFNDEWQ